MIHVLRCLLSCQLDTITSYLLIIHYQKYCLGYDNVSFPTT